MTDHDPGRGAWDPTAPFPDGARPTPSADPTVPFDPMTLPMTGAAPTFNTPGPSGYGGATPGPAQPPWRGTGYGGAASDPPAGYGGTAPGAGPAVPRATGYGRLPLIVAALAVLLVAGIVGGVVLLRSGNRADVSAGDGGGDGFPQLAVTETVATRATPTEATTTPPTTESADPQAEALTKLEELREQGLAAVTFDGRFAAQIASKYPGVSDRFQVAADGTHTFQATDILAEHERLRDEHGDDEHPVILVKSTDYGKRQLTTAGEPLWVTFVVGDFPDKQAVLDWCASHFGHLPAEEFKNQCDSRNLRPPA